MCKNIVEPGRSQMTIWCIRIACWIPKDTNTHSQYVILIAFHNNNGCTRGELSYLALLGSEKISAPYFKQCFFWGGGITSQTESNITPPSPKREIANILFYILNLWLRIYCSGLRGCDTREKEIVIWPCWCFMADIIFTLLSSLLCL